MRQTTNKHHRRGFVILSVFVIVTLALLVVTGIIYLTQSEVAARSRTTERAQSRAVAWSAVQTVMGELNAQRDVILNGERPQIESQYTLFEAGDETAVARLLPMNEAGDLLVPEASKLDLNEVDEETLIATGMIDESLAKEIINHRNTRPGQMYQSVAELCDVPGLSTTRVFGEADRFMVLSDAQQSAEQNSAASLQGGLAIAAGEETPFVDIFTVNAVEPAIQRNGRKKINLNTPWSDELGRRVDERFGQGASQVLKRLFDEMAFDDESKIIAPLISFQVELDRWPDIIDALTTEKGEYHYGRVDINTASQSILSAIPGIEAEQAAQIVQMRENLTPDERATIVWPALKDILPMEAYEDLAGKITTRSWTYRLRIASGIANPDEPDGPLENVIIYEVVIDLASPTPRVAYWRDITMLQTAAIVASTSPRASVLNDEISAEPAADPGADGSMEEEEASNEFDAGRGLDPADMNFDRDNASNGDGAGGESEDESSSESTEGGRNRLGRWTGGG